MRAIITFDLHLNDRPRDILTCADRLESAGWTGSFFVPTSMLDRPDFGQPLRELARRGYEIGTHAHRHNGAEQAALRGEGGEGLGFLERSSKTFADFFGRPPRTFRSPCWAWLCPEALDELARLGYHVDSSSTPQRPGLLSSFPFDNRHLLLARAPRFIRPGLLEVPTSTLLVPLGWPTFCTLRKGGSLVLARLLVLEASIRSPLVVVAQFHVSDLAPGEGHMTRHPFRWRDLVPRARGGIAARRWLRLTDRRRVAEVSVAVMSLMAEGDLVTFADVRSAVTSGANTPS
jgi:hypothetical protein